MLFSFAMATVVAAVEPDTWAKARILYYQGVDGNRDAAEHSARLIAGLHSRDPGNPLLTAYRGSTLLLEASWTFAPWRKGKLSKQGLALLDQAVEIAPADLEVRFIRAATTVRLPGIFQRGNQAQEDLSFLAERVGEAAASGRLDRQIAAAALLFHGDLRKKKGDLGGAQQAWKRAASLGPETPPGAAAARRLNGSE